MFASVSIGYGRLWWWPPPPRWPTLRPARIHRECRCRKWDAGGYAWLHVMWCGVVLRTRTGRPAPRRPPRSCRTRWRRAARRGPSRRCSAPWQPSSPRECGPATPPPGRGCARATNSEPHREQWEVNSVRERSARQVRYEYSARVQWQRARNATRRAHAHIRVHRVESACAGTCDPQPIQSSLQPQ